MKTAATRKCIGYTRKGRRFSRRWARGQHQPRQTGPEPSHSRESLRCGEVGRIQSRRNVDAKLTKFSIMAVSSRPIFGFARSQAPVTDILHFTGGLRAVKGRGGWQFGPAGPDGTGAIRGVPDEHIRSLGTALGVVLFGADEIASIDPHLPARIWTPLLGQPRLAYAANDSWAMISTSAQAAGEPGYARLARSLSVSLRAAGLQLRNASDEYNKQLEAALAGGRQVGTRFSNLAMDDVHLAFHALLSEMASARDYLARVAGLRAGAPDNVDALARLRQWASRPVNAAGLSDALVQRLLEASDVASSDPWLHDVGEYRNLFLHREHIGAIAPWLVLEQRDCPAGQIRTIAMAISERPGAQITCDALTRFVELHARLCRLADFAAQLAPFDATPQVFSTSTSDQTA